MEAVREAAPVRAQKIYDRSTSEMRRSIQHPPACANDSLTPISESRQPATTDSNRCVPGIDGRVVPCKRCGNRADPLFREPAPPVLPHIKRAVVKNVAWQT